MEAMDRRKADLVVEILDSIERLYTKEDVLLAFDATEEMRTSRQVNANALVVRNSPKMRRFMEAVVECSSDWHMISDEVSLFPNHPQFQEHRHDQSILSMMVKKFLFNEPLLIGPPAQPYNVGFCAFHTYKLFDHDDKSRIQQPYCPFPSFYKRHPDVNFNSTSTTKRLFS
jgi:hypothetical protein